MSNELHLMKEDNEMLRNSSIKCEINISIDKAIMNIQYQILTFIYSIIENNCELFLN